MIWGFYQGAGGANRCQMWNHSTVTVNKFSSCCAHSLSCWKALAPALIKTLITGKNRLNGSLKRLLMMFYRTRGNTSLRSGQKIKPGGKGFPQVHLPPVSSLWKSQQDVFKPPLIITTRLFPPIHISAACSPKQTPEPSQISTTPQRDKGFNPEARGLGATHARLQFHTKSQWINGHYHQLTGVMTEACQGPNSSRRQCSLLWQCLNLEIKKKDTHSQASDQ